ncbi:neuromedin U [Nordella sp. HKS 07]|uniref:neuromedin U n=1 Tax=Nordella sp. HKS 07 TaxID=2712222 RepID=UPI0013E11A0E|nr:neuromedin U [Nordella sp. HKS 07]QIG49855.1 neuromedin U [Nordella sp. HKS 07]
MAALTVGLLMAIPAAYAQEDLRAAAQNPIGNLISLPFQDNLNFGLGDTDNVQNVLNIQPVYPIHLSDSWNLITRPILPVIYQEPFFAGEELEEAEEILGDDAGRNLFGLGDLTWENFFSPREPTELAPGVGLVWGVGPVLQSPTATNDLLGTGKWSAGPAFVVFLDAKPLHITTGFLIFNIWSFAGDDDRADVDAMTLQPFLNYNLPEGWYLTSSPLMTANWEVDEDERWTVPIGGGFGRIFKIGDQPINANLAAYYNVVTPDTTGADWQLRAQWTFLFPER